MTAKRAIRLIAGVASLLVAVAACTPSAREAGRFPPLSSNAEDLFYAAYDQVRDKYVQTVALDKFAVDGLSGLGKVDSDTAIARTGNRVEFTYKGVPGALIDLPTRQGPSDMARFTVAAIEIARAASPKLQEAKSDVIYRAVLDESLAKLDRHSRYASPEQARENRANRQGFGGIGITLDMAAGAVRVGDVMADTPAAKAGLARGDQIMQIDDTPTAGLDSAEVVRRLRGAVGSSVAVKVKRESVADPFDLAIVRRHIVPTTVTYRAEGNVAYFRVSSFNEDTAPSLASALARARREIGPGMTGIVLDMRGNPGGLLDQAVAVSDLFLTRGRVVSARGRHRDSTQLFDATDGDRAGGLPLAVLTNGGSASAAEIVAGALQDHGRAIVVGTPSYGKGTVQTVLRLPNDGELVLTWAMLYAPAGYGMNDLGILPTICTSTAGTDAGAVAAALRDGRIKSGPVVAEWRNLRQPDAQTTSRLRATCPANDNDPEKALQIALRLLQDRGLYAQALDQFAPSVAQR